MLGYNIKISKNLKLVEGMIPRSILIEPDIANAVVYKKDDTIFLIDTGATLNMRKAIYGAIESLKPFRRFILLNSHAHPDHTANNEIINEVEAEDKKHYISGAGLANMDFESYFLDKYKEMDRYYNYLDGPRFPLSVATKGLKLLGAVSSRFKYLMVKNSLKKFMPVDTSIGTAEPFESTPPQALSGALEGWRGWLLCESVFAMESRGHSPDHVSFYIPDEKTLILADEAFPFFNCWPDSDSRNIEKALELSIEMVRNGSVETLITGHDHEIFTGAMIEQHLVNLLSDYRYFRNAVIDIVKDHSGGITVNKIYSKLRADDKSPVLKKYFSLEFPRMPPMLKTVITSLLMEDGCEVGGPEGKALFSKNEHGKIF